MSAIDLVERLKRRVPVEGRPFKSDMTKPLNPDGPEAADTITRLQAALEDARGCLEGTQALIKAMSGRESIAIETAIERIDAARSSVGGE